MEKIVLLQENVTTFLENLIQILFEKEYFSYEKSAQQYVSKIYDFIENHLIKYPHKTTPKNLSQLGSKFVFYKANNHTTWYIFFENKDSRYLVTYITNNHMEDVKFL
ncbi:MAG: hypothetical protein WDZ45_11710 [Flavobacteriaceae bacterium]